MKTKTLPAGWKEVELGQVCEVNPKKSEVQDIPENEEITFLGMEDIGEHGEIYNKRIRKLSEVIKGYTYFRRNDVLVAKITPCMENGKGAIANIKTKIGFGSTEFHVLRPKKEILPEWIYLFVHQERIRDSAEKNMTGSAGQRRVPTTFLKSLKIALPPLPVQKKIVSILEKAEKLKQQRAEADRLTKEYVQSVFYEMFMKKEFEEVKLEDVCEITSSKRIYENEYVNEGVPFYRSKEVIELSQREAISIELFISDERYEELKNKFGVPKKGDLLITAVGTIGKSYVIPDNKEFYFKDGNLLWLRKLSNVNSTYLNYFLSNHFNKNKNDLSSGSAYNALTIVKLNQLVIPLPPLPLQRKFAAIVEKVEVMKEQQEKSKLKIDNLFNSLMQKVFSGELVK